MDNVQPRDLTTLSDEALCALSRGGEQQATELLAERYIQTVRRIARPYFLAGGDSEDLSQEGMLGLLLAIREYVPEKASFHTFAALCIRRRIYSAIRKAQGRNQTPLNTAVPFESDPDDDSPRPWADDVAEDPEAVVIHRDEQRRIAAEVDTLLSGFEKRVLSLYLDGQSFAEMARRLGRPVKSIDNAVTRIRNKLSRHYLRPSPPKE